jgi:hypothetical protein
MTKALRELVDSVVSDAVESDHSNPVVWDKVYDAVNADPKLLDEASRIESFWRDVDRKIEAARFAKRAADRGMDARVFAIREDHIVGRGTCSTIDECYADSEIVEALNKERIRAPKAAVRWARSIHKLHKDIYNDVRATAW